jgi:hypothetical protein
MPQRFHHASAIGNFLRILAEFSRRWTVYSMPVLITDDQTTMCRAKMRKMGVNPNKSAPNVNQISGLLGRIYYEGKISDSSLSQTNQPGGEGDLSRIAGSLIRIELPKQGQLRSRKVVTRSRARFTGKYPSWKMQRMVQWESSGELKVFKLLDCDPEVKSFHEQPFTIHYQLGGRWRRHYPDILIERDHSMEVWEVKAGHEALLPEFEERSKLLQTELPKHGFRYRVIASTDFDDPGRLTHAEILLRFGRSQITLFDRELLRRLSAKGGPLVWNAAERGQYGPKGRQAICRLVLEGKLEAQLDLLPSPGTRFVWRGEGR